MRGDAQPLVNLEAQEGGEIQVHGSSNLVQTLLEHDLIDLTTPARPIGIRHLDKKCPSV